MPRPSEFDPVIGDLICDRIIEGESLRAICEDPDLPAKSTVMKWLASGQHPAFVDQYARAREISADTDEDDIGHYARQAAKGEIEPGAATAAINGLKWTAGKKAPKKYGDTSTVKHAGAIGHFDASKYTDEQLAALEIVLEPLAAAGGDAEGDSAGEGEAGG
jgi:hypothetical protein